MKISGQFWFKKVGFGQFCFGLKNCEKSRGQKKWAFGQFF